MRELLGGKGANLAEMNLIGVPVPPGFTITTEVCTEYYDLGKDKVVELLREDVEKAIANIENLMNSKFGDVENPLLVSVRSGARASMPGMMDTILNLGLNDEVVEGLTRKTGRPRFAWDSYRRFVQMYGDVVLGMKPVNKDDIDPFEAIIEEVKEAKGVKLDNELEVEDLKELVKHFKAAVKEQTGQDFPTSAYEQLWGAVCAVFRSWMNERAILYRKMEGIPAEWGTAVTVQAMVFGNMGDTSATGVCFSRDAGNGEDLFNGEYLINAQGEDVVAGIRTPQQITKIGSQRWAERAGISEEERVAKYPSMEEAMPEIYKELDALQTKLEDHYRDMQDMEFTVQEGKLWFLQTRNGKRTGAAMVKIAMDLLRQGMIDEKTALKRCEPNKLDELLHPVFDKQALKEAKVLTRGLPASPGAATGQVVFFAEDAAKWAADGKKVVMVQNLGYLKGRLNKKCYPLMWNLIDSHDTARFLHLCNGNKKKQHLAAAFQLLLPGMPMIYYGDEFAMPGANDPDCRRGMYWDEEYQDKEMYEWYKQLLWIRKKHACISEGELIGSITKDEEETIVLIRKNVEETIALIFNCSSNARNFSEYEGKYNLLRDEPFDGKVEGLDAAVIVL